MSRYGPILRTFLQRIAIAMDRVPVQYSSMMFRLALKGATLMGLTFGADLKAQSAVTVLPAGADRVELDGSFAPAGRPSVSRFDPLLHQLAYDRAQLARVSTRTWNLIEFRPDRTGLAASLGARIAVRLSSRGVPEPDAMSLTDRNANRGQNVVQVIRPRQIVLPVVAPSSGSIPQRPIRLVFDTPFLFGGGGRDGLLIELEWLQTSGSRWVRPALDALQLPRTEWRLNLQRDPASCARSGRVGLAFDTIGGTEHLVLVPEFGGTGVSSNISVTLLLGGSTAPQALGGIGMPGCVLRVQPAVALPTNVLSTSGGAKHYALLRLPKRPEYSGAAFALQAVVPDRTANAAGLTMSDTLDARISAWPGPIRARAVTWLAGTNGGARLPVNDLFVAVTLR